MIPKRPDFWSWRGGVGKAKSLMPPGFEALLSGILIALVSSVIVLGGFALSLQESRIYDEEGLHQDRTLTSPATYQATYTEVLEIPNHTSIANHLSNSATLPPASPTFTKTPNPTITITFTPLPTNCPIPCLYPNTWCTNTGWMAIIINPGDTLTNLAQIHGSTPEILASVNCLNVDVLLPGATLYVPVFLPTLTTTFISCGPPPGWVYYKVQPGDTLFHLSQVFGVSVWQLQQANCLGSSTIIRTGQLLYVPYWLPIHTPIFIGTLTATTTPTSTRIPIPTLTKIPPTWIPSATPTKVILPTHTSTPLPTCTPSPTNLPTDVPTDRPTPSQTPTPGESD